MVHWTQSQRDAEIMGRSEMRQQRSIGMLTAALLGLTLVTTPSLAQKGPSTTPTQDSTQQNTPQQENTASGPPIAGLFCDAIGYPAILGETDRPLCDANTTANCMPADDNSAATLLIGAPQDETRMFGYEIWYGNGHSCAQRGTLRLSGGLWGYEDSACRLVLREGPDGVTLRPPQGSFCDLGCGARASFGGVRAPWNEARTTQPDRSMLEELESICSAPDSRFAQAASQPDQDPPRASAQGDAFTLAPDIARPFRAQRMLNSLGYSLGAIDGQFGSQSRQALATFLRDQGADLGADLGEGNLTDTTFAVLQTAFDARPIAPRSDDPREMVKSIYDPTNPNVWIFAFVERADWFTHDTLDLIARGELNYTQRFGIDGFDFNPVIPGQDYQLSNVVVTQREPPVDGRAVIDVGFENFGQPVAMQIVLMRERGAWFIHDILDNGESMRAMIATF